MATARLDYVGDSGSQGDRESVVLNYWIDDAIDQDDAESAMIAAAPPSLGTLVIVGVQADGETDDVFKGTVTYGPKKLDESTYSFEIGVAQTKITQSLETVGAYALPGRSPSNLFQAINVTRDGVEGTEISVPQFTWNETHYLPKAQMSRAFFFVLFNTVATMNADPFRGFDPGEVLLIGVNGSASQYVSTWEMQFKFLALPNSSGGSINNIAIGPKLGHDYLWVRYLDQVDNNANAMVKLPYEVFIERVYQSQSYANLRLPDPF